MTTRKGYMVESSSSDYNDEYFSPSNGVTYEGHVFLKKEDAERRALELNAAHAKEVASDVGSWLYDERLGHQVEAGDEDAVRRLFRIFLPEGDASRPLKQLIEELDDIDSVEGDISDDDAAWLAENVSGFANSQVVEVDVEECTPESPA